ncbi:MAG: hypothetical protein GY827_00805 [Cytophagales bacterium]|nr:hypothetical protein [Cytophagales bacterium]
MPFFEDKFINIEKLWKNTTVIVFAFGILCLISTSFFLSESHITEKSSSQDGILVMDSLEQGVYNLQIRSDIENNQWVFLEVSAEDENETTLFSLGKELWKESGYDEGYYWAEDDRKLEYDFVLPEGKTSLEIKCVETKSGSAYPFYVHLYKRSGSPLIFLMVGVSSLIISIISILIIYKDSLFNTEEN